MRHVLIALLCFLLLPMLAFAETAPVTGPDVVSIPRVLVGPIVQAILHPHSADVGEILAVVQQFQACVEDNPVDGAVLRVGRDQCPIVSQALDARDKQLADARKGAEKAAQTPAHAPPPPVQSPASTPAPPAQPPAPAAAAADQHVAPPANATDGHQ